MCKTVTTKKLLVTVIKIYFYDLMNLVFYVVWILIPNIVIVTHLVTKHNQTVMVKLAYNLAEAYKLGAEKLEAYYWIMIFFSCYLKSNICFFVSFQVLLLWSYLFIWFYDITSFHFPLNILLFLEANTEKIFYGLDDIVI